MFWSVCWMDGWMDGPRFDGKGAAQGEERIGKERIGMKKEEGDG